MKEILRLRFLLRDNEKIVVPMDKKGNVKSFTFHSEIVNITPENVSKNNLKQLLFIELVNSVYLNEFIIQVFEKQYEVFLASISFDIGEQTFSYSYVNDEYIDDYWITDPKLFLDEEYGRIEQDNYNYDDYIRRYGMEEDNFKFSVMGIQRHNNA